MLSWTRHTYTSFIKTISVICTSFILSAVRLTNSITQNNSLTSSPSYLSGESVSGETNVNIESANNDGDTETDSVLVTNDDTDLGETLASEHTSKSLFSSVRKTVTTTTEWYSDRVQKNSLVWCWIPLLLLLLLAALGGKYFFIV